MHSRSTVSSPTFLVFLQISYTVYRLASGAYYKYSSGGTPVYLWSLGYGNEGKDDLDAVYRFRLGDANSLPPTAMVAMKGMTEGGRRRVLVPPNLGWRDNKSMLPKPDTFGGFRRLEAHKDEPLLLEVELKKVLQGSDEVVGGWLHSAPPCLLAVSIAQWFDAMPSSPPFHFSEQAAAEGQRDEGTLQLKPYKLPAPPTLSGGIAQTSKSK